MKTLCSWLTMCLCLIPGPASMGQGGGKSVAGLKLKVSANQRYLEDQNGKPFFYLGDTAWTLFKRLNREEVEEYLGNRAAKGFTVIQAYVLRGLNVRNVYGELTVLDRDPTRFNEAFFKNVDWVVGRANDLGLVVAMVVSYGEHVNGLKEKVFDSTNAFTYGKLLGSRYKDRAVIWYLGGDRNPDKDVAVWDAMAKGLKEGSGGAQLVSYHGPGPRMTPDGPTGYSSSFWFHDRDWLDYNVLQSGHRWAVKNYGYVAHDYVLTPVKPVIDMEARYENHPDGPDATRRMDAHQEREAAYWAMMAGAAGHGYGCNDIWQFYNPARMPAPDDDSFPFARLRGNTIWREAMNFDGAYHMGMMRKLFEARPWYKLVPDQSLITSGQGEGEDRVGAARASDGSFVLAYSTFGNPFTIKMDAITGSNVKAQWYDPRVGQWQLIGKFANRDTREFVPPRRGPQSDWVLVLEDARKQFPAH